MKYGNEIKSLSQIRPGPYQHREEFSGIGDLAASIEAEGLINPPLVTQEGLLLAGERRWRAMVVNGLVAKGVMGRSKAVAIAEGGADDRWRLIDLATRHLGPVMTEVRLAPAGSNARVLTVIENGQRQNLNPIEEGRDYQSLVEDGHGLEVIAEMVNKAVSTVRARLLLLKLEPDLQDWVIERKLPKTLDVLQALLAIDAEARLGLARRAVETPGFTKDNLLKACRAYQRTQKRKAQVRPQAAASSGDVPAPTVGGSIPIAAVEPSIVYHPTGNFTVCPACADGIHQLLEECCGPCAANGASQKCLKCEGFLEFANRLINGVNSAVEAHLNL